ncbi:MAG: glycosyltransferase family 2 protein [Verrucomicrobia bacterium]|nr:glycosyltransferase family 2 protein [Verrucomicrobiota bacterium]MBS0646743.1 glycosyltransferase family 2 protein [Verrucomicrobiota bacterium]
MESHHHRKPIITLIPCYNVAQVCEHVITEVLSYSDLIVLIDDGSTDGTSLILKRLERRYPHQIHLICFDKNQGKGAALLTGFHYILSKPGQEIIVTFDSDGQHSACHIPILAQGIQNGADLVVGSRQFSLMPFFSRLGNTAISWLVRRVYPHAPIDTQSGMRALSRSLIQDIISTLHVGRFEMEMRCLLLALKHDFCVKSSSIPTIYHEKNRLSHFSKIKDSFLILKMLAKHVKKQE